MNGTLSMLPEHDRRSNCVAHEQNTTDLANLKGSISTIKWLWPLLFAAISGILAFTINYVLQDIKGTMLEIKADVKELTYTVSQSAIIDATTRLEVEQLKKDVAEIRFTLNKMERK